MPRPESPTNPLAGPVPAADPREQTVHHESQRQKRNRRGTSSAEDMQLNLTSMIDVIFLLLIYFVITSNFVINEGVLTAKLPVGTGIEQAAPEKPPDTPMNIDLTSASETAVTISLDNQMVAGFNALRERLIELQADPDRGRTGFYKPDNPVIIRPAGEVRWQHVVNAFNAAKAARYSNVSFATAAE